MKWKKVKIILELSEIAYIYPSFIFWIKIILAIYVMDHKYPYDVIFVIGTDMIVYLGSPTWGKKIPLNYFVLLCWALSGEKKTSTFLFELLSRIWNFNFEVCWSLFELQLACWRIEFIVWVLGSWICKIHFQIFKLLRALPYF